MRVVMTFKNESKGCSQTDIPLVAFVLFRRKVAVDGSARSDRSLRADRCEYEHSDVEDGAQSPSSGPQQTVTEAARENTASSLVCVPKPGLKFPALAKRYWCSTKT
jgi:hypothetical protein